MQSLAFTSPMVRHSRQNEAKETPMQAAMSKKFEQERTGAFPRQPDLPKSQHIEYHATCATATDAGTDALHSACTANIYAATASNVGALYFKQNEMDEAMRWYRQGTLALGRSLQDDDEPQGQTNDFSPSLDDYTKAISKENQLMVAAAISKRAEDERSKCEFRPLNLNLFDDHSESSLSSSSLALPEAAVIDKSSTLDMNMVSSLLFHNMALVHYRLGRLDNAMWLFSVALAAIEPLDEDLSANINQILGQIYCRQNKWEKGLEHLSKSAALDDRLLFDMTTHDRQREQHISAIQDRLANTLSRIGQLHFAAGNYDKAMDHCNDVLSIQMKYLPFHDIKIAATFYNVGMILREQGELSEALSYCDWFVKHASSRLGYLHPQVLQALHTIGELQHQNGCYVEAQKTLRQCSARRRKSNEDIPHRDTATTLVSLGQVHQDIGLHNAALNAYQEAMEILSMLPEDVLEDKAAILWNIAQVHQRNHESDKAMRAYEQILPLVRSIEIDHDSYARLHISIGNIYLERGRLSEAMSSFATAERVSPSIESRGAYFADSVCIYMSCLLFADVNPAASAA